MLTINHRLFRLYLVAGAQHSLRQTIPSYYSRNGLCYAVRREHLIEKGNILEEDCVGVVIDRHIVNIDERLSLNLANFLFSVSNLLRAESR